MAASTAPEDDDLDLAIVGAGLCGVITLHYARQAGLRAVALEKQAGIGGLWRTLPAWQDIQISPSDWALEGLPLASGFQPDILAFIEGWVRRFRLADGIRLNTAVRRARQAGTGWALELGDGSVLRARHLVAATGAHNRPVVPAVPRDAATVRELHSSALRDPAELTGRCVLVVGGGASAFDLLDLALQHGARRIVWVHRGLMWFLPTGKPKAIGGSVRGFARQQASGASHAEQSAAITAEMRARYARFGVQAIMPERPFDVLHDQLIPGRHRMLARFQEIERHAGTVERIAGGTVHLTDGRAVAPDLLLWATGYASDLSWIDHPGIAAVRGSNELALRCGGIARSLDAHNLWFPQVGLEGIGAAPWGYALLARSIVSHLRGTARLDLVPVGRKVNHFDLVDYLAARDPASFPPQTWRAHYRALQLETPDDQPYPVP